jgi:2-oxoglutarate ferredoxin oxidoreductase subunit alpha
VPKLFDLIDKFQCPGIILSDLLLSEGRSSVDPAELDFNVSIERGDVIGLNGATAPLNGGYKRYEINDSGISARALPGTPGFEHVVATDDHDEDGVLISDEYTNPHKRQAMHEKRMRKMEAILPLLDAPKFWGTEDAHVTLLGWGSTEGVMKEAINKLAGEGIAANLLQIKWIVPLHCAAITATLAKSQKVIIVENNYSGQFARYLRSETGILVDGHIRKYDGEPFMPHHIVDGVKAILAGRTQKYVPVHEIMV